MKEFKEFKEALALETISKKSSIDWNLIFKTIDYIESLIFQEDIYYEFRMLGGTIVGFFSSKGDEIGYVDYSDSRLEATKESVMLFIEYYESFLSKKEIKL